jgi:membrane-bound serine protease (ClpP class)
MNKRLTLTRLIIAILTEPMELFAIWAVWRWLLPALGIRLDVWVLIVLWVGWFLFGIFLFIMGTRALDKKEVKGLTSMVGSTGKASGRLAPDGMVKIKGELWNAHTEEGAIESGENIVVVGEEGLKLLVRKA